MRKESDYARQYREDHSRPFRDVGGERLNETAERIAGIDRDRLQAWWERVKHLTYPGSYGDCGCGRASSVAFHWFSPKASGQPDALCEAVDARWNGRALTLIEVRGVDVYALHDKGRSADAVPEALTRELGGTTQRTAKTTMHLARNGTRYRANLEVHELLRGLDTINNEEAMRHPGATLIADPEQGQLRLCARDRRWLLRRNLREAA